MNIYPYDPYLKWIVGLALRLVSFLLLFLILLSGFALSLRLVDCPLLNSCHRVLLVDLIFTFLIINV